MNSEELLEITEKWRFDEYFNLYYGTGHYHSEILKLLKLDTLEDFKNYLIGLMPHGTKGLWHTEEFELLRERERLINEKINSFLTPFTTIDDSENIKPLTSDQKEVMRSSKIELQEIEELKSPLIQAAHDHDKSNDATHQVAQFFFGHLEGRWYDLELPVMESFVNEMQPQLVLSTSEKSIIENWQSILEKALSHNSYSIYRNFEKRKYPNSMNSDMPLGDADYYQVLSAYLLAIRNSYFKRTYRVDEKERVHLDFGNGIIATLFIKELPIKTHLSQVKFGSITTSNAISYSGYNKSLYILSSLKLFFEGYELDFKFQAYSVLMGSGITDHNAAARLYDDEQERLEEEMRDY